MNKGFTIIELIVVVLILGILVSLGSMRLAKIHEISRALEAKTILGLIRTTQKAYRVEHDSYAQDLSELDMVGPNTCNQADYYFTYVSSEDCDGAKCAAAIRCTHGGKSPPGGNAYIIKLNLDTGKFTIPDDIS